MLDVSRAIRNKVARSRTLFHSGHRNITHDRWSERWKITLRLNGKNKHFGLYQTLNEAIEAKKQILEKLRNEKDIIVNSLDFKRATSSD